MLLAETNSLQLQNLIIHHSRRKRVFNFAFDCFSVSSITSNVQDLSALFTKHDYIIETAYPGGSAPALEELYYNYRTY